MIGALIAKLAGSAWARTALRCTVMAFAILLFLLALRRFGERAGRLAERLETMEGTHDVQERMLEAAVRRLARATIWLSGCATGASEGVWLGACPALVEYSREVQTRAAGELASLPGDSAIAEMMSDYAVLRDQALACRGPAPPQS